MSIDPRRAVAYSGFLNICKPPNVTSRDVVNRVERTFRAFAGQRIRCGHAGTLDPIATGVLLVCTGHATRFVPWVHEFPKTYRAGFTLGQTSDTDDSRGTIRQLSKCGPPTHEALLNALACQTGTIMQRPPAFSAIKISGKRAYKLARAGQTTDLAPRPTTIHHIQIERYEYPLVECLISCCSGTYIRSIARDVGESLGCGGLMHSLVRTSIGPFNVAESVEIASADDGELTSQLLSPIRLFPQTMRLPLNATQIERLRDGKSVTIHDGVTQRLVATDDHDEFLALLEVEDVSRNLYRPLLNWTPLRYGK
jgi:tRNA pseudouridine55 synthase